MAAEPDGSRFYYVPGAHGRVPELGTPVIAVVHGDNAASARLFARAGYADDGTGPDADGFHTLRRTL